MKLSEMLAFWELKGMISHKVHQYGSELYKSDRLHDVYKIHVGKSKHSVTHAVIIYRVTKNHVSLIYADILFSGNEGGANDAIFKVNASVKDLQNEFIGYDN